jgi:hypothetical protein
MYLPDDDANEDVEHLDECRNDFNSLSSHLDIMIGELEKFVQDPGRCQDDQACEAFRKAQQDCVEACDSALESERTVMALVDSWAADSGTSEAIGLDRALQDQIAATASADTCGE